MGKRDATKMSFSPPTGPRAGGDRDAMDVDDQIEGKGKNRKYVLMLNSPFPRLFLTSPQQGARLICETTTKEAKPVLTIA